MKKKIAGILLTAVLAITAAGFGVAGVSADETQPDAEIAAEDETAETEDAETLNPDADAEDAVQEDVESTSEEADEDTDVKTESTEAETEVTGMKVVLINNLGIDLSSLDVKNFTADEYSENLLKKDSTFKAGETCTIGIPDSVQDQDLGMYDVRITSTDGQVTEIPLVPFIENVTGTLCTEEGTVLIQIRDERLEAEEDNSSMAEIGQQEEQINEARSEALAAEAAAAY